MTLLVVTGTGTDVGKTVVTAAIAGLALDRFSRVAVVKPAQTGVRPGEPGDLDEVARLSGADNRYELARYRDPLSPAAAARRSGMPPLDLNATAARIAALESEHDLVIVEGAGGLLVRYNDDGATLADLAYALRASVVVVVRAGLGTLNETALTLEVMASRGVLLDSVVIGSWPHEPDLAARCNLRDLETLSGRPLGGALPEGSGRLDKATFRLMSRSCLGSAYGGGFDATLFRTLHEPAQEGTS
ncbi:MAG: dethiobiotin synthetase [Frankiales bacterium]|jgi:dethiobiotin synthetase|nr:dethiobiotin synthetase [Frankiales bacterium]MDX6208891.1 dethiobiotin synthetase [Frankiales bacterium]